MSFPQRTSTQETTRKAAKEECFTGKCEVACPPSTRASSYPYSSRAEWRMGTIFPQRGSQGEEKEANQEVYPSHHIQLSFVLIVPSSRPDPQQQCLIQQDRDRHQERWSARSGGPYPEDPKGRSSSDYSEPRSHASSPLKPRRHEAPPLEEQFQRRRPRRQHHRIREERSPGLSEAASEDVSAHQRMNSEQQLSVWAPMEVLPKKIRHSRRSEPPVRSNMVESEKPQRLEDGKIHGRGSMEHFISKSRPLKISSRFDTASTDTVVG